MPSETADYPWQKVAMDLADIEGTQYLVMVDYFSKYPEFFKMSATTSSAIIEKCKATFARFGIPSVVRSDNGRQFVSREFMDFAKEYGFKLITSSPKFPQSNGQAESAVKIVKNIVNKSEDPYLGILAYRNTPVGDMGASPAQLLMSRQLRTTLPTSAANLQPKVIPRSQVVKGQVIRNTRAKENFDRRHNSREAPPLVPGQRVWVRDLQRQGRVLAQANTPRSYIVLTSYGRLRRNVAHLGRLPVGCPDEDPVLGVRQPLYTSAQGADPLQAAQAVHGHGQGGPPPPPPPRRSARQCRAPAWYGV
jgi:hypothetical protein